MAALAPPSNRTNAADVELPADLADADVALAMRMATLLPALLANIKPEARIAMRTLLADAIEAHTVQTAPGVGGKVGSKTVWRWRQANGAPVTPLEAFTMRCLPIYETYPSPGTTSSSSSVPFTFTSLVKPLRIAPNHVPVELLGPVFMNTTSKRVPDKRCRIIDVSSMQAPVTSI
jgi:hypothetical protein